MRHGDALFATLRQCGKGTLCLPHSFNKIRTRYLKKPQRQVMRLFVILLLTSTDRSTNLFL